MAGFVVDFFPLFSSTPRLTPPPPSPLPPPPPEHDVRMGEEEGDSLPLTPRCCVDGVHQHHPHCPLRDAYTQDKPFLVRANYWTPPHPRDYRICSGRRTYSRVPGRCRKKRWWSREIQRSPSVVSGGGVSGGVRVGGEGGGVMRGGVLIGCVSRVL